MKSGTWNSAFATGRANGVSRSKGGLEGNINIYARFAYGKVGRFAIRYLCVGANPSLNSREEQPVCSIGSMSYFALAQ